MAKKRLYDYRAFNGTDASLEISLFEYGLIWKKVKKDYKFIYGIKVNDVGDYIWFDCAYMPIDTDIKEEFGWIDDWSGILSSVGMTEKEFMDMSLPQQICDLISYYGYENVFGSCYYGFEISGNTQIA
jgi:hypothetical protein